MIIVNYILFMSIIFKNLYYRYFHPYLNTRNYTSNLQNNKYKDFEKINILQTNDNYLKNKKLITISPGGFKGFYLLGTLTFIKENYDLSNYIFSGASAGAWCSLIMTMNKKFDLFEFIDNNITNAKSILEVEIKIKQKLLERYKENDFDLNRVFIGVTSLEKLNFHTNIYSHFKNLEDAIDCCIASSHVPFITGGIYNNYHNKINFDGGFIKNPYFSKLKPVIHISPDLWNKEKKHKLFFIYETTILFPQEKQNFEKHYLAGYNDAKKNKDFLHKIFNSNE